MLRNRIFKGIGVAAGVIMIGTTIMLSCSKDTPTNAVEATWAFTVNVVDGYNGSKIANARVDYKNVKAKDTFALTNSLGQAQISGLLAGTHIFSVSYTNTTAAIDYTDAVLTISSKSDSSSLKKLADQQATVTLFPLSGQISGKILSQLHDAASKAPVAGLTVSLSFSDPDLLTDKAFQTKTDSSGSFQMSQLPLADGLKISIPNASIGGIDFAPDTFVTPVLQNKTNVPMGTIMMRPIDSKNFKRTGSVPSTITPNQTITLTYSDAVDSLSNATLDGLSGAPTVQTKCSVSGATMSITPSISLIDGSIYCLTAHAFGKAGGNAATKDTVTVKGGGVVDVVSSNVLDANHQAIDGLGLSDSMVFKFRSAVAKASASVTKSETVILVDVSFHDSVLVVKPRGSWESGTYDVKISATLADSTISTFNFKITTVAGLDIIESNIYNFKTKSVINGLKVTDTITVTANKPLSSAEVTLSLVTSPANINVPVTKSVSGATVKIISNEPLRFSTPYAFTITVTTAQKESKSFSIPSTAPFTTASSNFYPVADNIRTNGDPSKPVLNFLPNGTIIIKMSATLKSATAILTGDSGRVISTETKFSADTIRITPVANLNEGVGYSLKLSAESSSGVVYSEDNFVTKFYVKNTFIPKHDNVRFDNDPKKPVLDFAPGGIIVIVMTDSVQSATAALLNAGAIVGADVKTNKDTIRIIPHDLLSPSISYDISLAAKSRTGLSYQAESAPYFVTGFRVQVNQVRVIASNVISADGLGLTNLPVNIVPYYVLSVTPDPTSLAITMYAGDTVKMTVAVKGDTVTVKPVINLAAATQYKVIIKGKTTSNDPINIDLSGSNKVFTTRVAVIVAASNMLDANGKPVTNLSPSTELWVKFSRALSTDLTKQQLGGGVGTTVAFRSGATNNNATVRISGDTLFAKFLANALPGDGDTVSLRGINILFDDGTTLGPDEVNLKAYIVRKPTPYVIATNGLVGNTVVDTFGVLGEAWIVSSMSFRSVDGVKNGPDNFTNVPAANLLLSNVRTRGDTIFFKPAIRLAYGTEYQVAFNVTMTDSSKYTGSDLKLRWKTQKGVYLVSANDMASAAAYRPFSLTGDSLVLTFSKVIDITKTVALGGFVTRMTYAWSGGNTILTVKPVDTLITKPYTPNPDYSQQTGTGQYEGITITLTTLEGEAWTAKPANVTSIFNNARPPLEIHTVPGIEVLNTTLKVSSANKNQFYVNTDNSKLSDLVTRGVVAQNDSVGIGDTLKVYFSAAVDSAAVARTPAMVRLLLGTTTQNISIGYASAHKTMFIKSANVLTTGATYTLSLTNVQGSGMAANDPNGDISYSLAFKTRPTAKRLLTTATVTLIADTARTPGVLNKRLAYSGAKGNPYGVTGGTPSLNPNDVPAPNTVRLMFYELAFQSASVADTVSHYQLSVKGIDGNWHNLRNLVLARHYRLAAPDSLHRDTLNLSGSVLDDQVTPAEIGPGLRIAAREDYQNDSNIFNYGANLQVRIRPVLSANGVWDATTDQAGNWSTPITFQDNVAPCDTDFVAKDADSSRLHNVNRGGVGIAVAPCVMNRASLTASSQYIFTFTFPEDMDTAAANKPTITTWYGGTTTPPTTGITMDNTSSWITNAYTYKLIVTIPGNVDWTDVSKLPYYSISIAGMKDASGQVIQTWGDVGNARNGLQPTGVIGDSEGTVNMRGLTLY